MEINNETIKAYFQKPLLFLKEENLEEINEYVIKNYLTYSIGFEIECYYKEKLNIKEINTIFNSIPFLVENNSDNSEKRFRIQNGIKGLITLYFLQKLFIKFFQFNSESGIHYHIDATDLKEKEIIKIINTNKDYILKELDTWEYKGYYNLRERSWIRCNSLLTFEIRIGEMTFDYFLILKRILHCNNIINNVRNYSNLQKKIKDFSFSDEERQEVFTFLNNNLNIFNVIYFEDKQEKNIGGKKISNDDIKTINNRTKIINIKT